MNSSKLSELCKFGALEPSRHQQSDERIMKYVRSDMPTTAASQLHPNFPKLAKVLSFSEIARYIQSICSLFSHE